LLSVILNPETYLFVAVKNQSLNHIKKYSSIHLVQIEETNSVEFVNTYNPQREIENKELIFRMDKAITALPQQCRIVFRLIKEDGMKYKEVAEILNISPRTVQTQLFRAVKKLSIVLSNYDKLNNPFTNKSGIKKPGATGKQNDSCGCTPNIQVRLFRSRKNQPLYLPMEHELL
jgi:DNA-binding CsgD family transcriptional regulator